MAVPLAIGHRVPNITLPSSDGKQICLTDYAGTKNIVLFFYPEDETPGCTKEACAFRDSLTSFEKKDTVILGVSTDSLEKHTKFIANNNLPFPLLSDSEAVLSRWFGVYDEDEGEARRVTFLIGKDGRVKEVWDPVKVDGHADDVLHSIS